MKALQILMMGSKQNEIKYGLLYNWFAASHPNIAPIGYHVPTAAEFQTLSNYLGGDSVSGGKLKEPSLDHWDSPNVVDATPSGFDAFGGGSRIDNGSFYEFLMASYFWTTTSVTSNWSLALRIINSDTNVSFPAYNKTNGFSLRFIKDNSTDNGSVTDYDGNVYNTITIGTQVWTTSNFKCTKYNDGTPIENVPLAARWIKMDTVIPDYGHLYKLNSLIYDSTNNRPIEPNTNWKVPTTEDYQALFTQLGGTGTAGGALKLDNPAFWNDGNVLGTASGFNSLAAGYSYISDTYLIDYRYSARFCAMNFIDNLFYYYYGIYNYIYDDNIVVANNPAAYGFSLRFIWVGIGAAPSTLTDREGNVYPVVQIGSQYWTAKNFKCTTDRNGDAIPEYFNTDIYAAYKAGVNCAYDNDNSLI